MANKEQPVSDPTTTERAAFEAWLSKATAEEGPWPSTRECAWSAWQAARRAQPAREPLTGAQVSGGFANCGLGGINAKLGFNAGVRFAENAHGITQKDAG